MTKVDRLKNDRCGWHLPPAFYALLGLAGLLLVNWFFIPSFFEIQLRDGNFYGSLIDVLNRGSIGVLLALGMTLVIATGGVDLSVGSIVAICGAVVAIVLTCWQAGIWVALAAGLLAALVAGAANGVLVAWLKIEPIIATLVLMVSGRGIAKFIAGEQTVAVPAELARPTLNFIGNGHFLGLPFPITIAIVLFVATWMAVRRTSIGLLIESVGANPSASRACGINDRAVKMAVYVFAGFCAGVAGVIDLANISIADPTNAGALSELDAIFAVLVGGTALTGGRFSLIGAVIGALLLQTLMTTLYTWGVPSDVAPVPKAIVILLVCLLQSPKLRSAVSSALQGKQATTPQRGGQAVSP
jgi:simple sugar transport system permease protein